MATGYPTGFRSNYIDSGWDVSFNGWYNDEGSVISATFFQPTDIYTNTQQVGVYMLNENKSSIYPIFCSLANLQNIGIPNSVDGAWLVYPGYGFTLYESTNYSGTQSRSYLNNNPNGLPALFYNPGGGYNGIGAGIITTTGSNYTQNSTKSVKIYFRYQQISITGLS
jgi:hypothetical protein